MASASPASQSSSSSTILPVKDVDSSNYWNKQCDPRTVNFWLMSNGPWKLSLFTIGYLLTLYFGKKWMKNRPPYQLRLPMLIYNIILVVINFYFLLESLNWIEYGYKLLDFKFPSAADRSPKTMRIVNMFYYYQWTKFIDYFDSFFFILRKKEKQLSVLHVYHHISVPIIGWISSWVSHWILTINY